MRQIIVLLTVIFSMAMQNCQTQSFDYPVSEFDDSSSFNLEKYSDIVPVRNEPNKVVEGWENYYFLRSDCRCLFDGEYFVAVKDISPGVENLMITLQGGGASWPGMEKAKEEVYEKNVRVSNFAIALADRLEEEWNQVLLPYCDGSVFMGDRAADYDNDGIVDHFHWGFRASSAAMALTKKKFPVLEKVMITGCSAGGYGTIIMSRLVRHYYPEAKIYVINESGAGLLNPTDKETWESIKETWKLDQLIPEDCDLCDGQLIYWYDAMLAKDSLLTIGLFSSYEDYVISDNFLEMTPEDFRSFLVEISGNLHEKYPRKFKRFFIEGNLHCIEDRYYKIDSITYWDWVLQLMNESEEWEDLLELTPY